MLLFWKARLDHDITEGRASRGGFDHRVVWLSVTMVHGGRDWDRDTMWAMATEDFPDRRAVPKERRPYGMHELRS
jgi:hypothetical protein